MEKCDRCGEEVEQTFVVDGQGHCCSECQMEVECEIMEYVDYVGANW